MSDYPVKNYGLDEHCSKIIEQYREYLPVFQILEKVVNKLLEDRIRSSHIYVTAIETRIKTERSLAGKLELKGYKYDNIESLTDIVGARIITFYTDEVDKIAAMVDRMFSIDWQNSIDKRKIHNLDSFGYNSLHYICRVPKESYFDPEHPEINEIRFELQMRTALQHVWATIEHDLGYKGAVSVPDEYLRNINRLAGMLELADEQFSKIRTEITDYRRKVCDLVASGNLSDVPLTAESFVSYLNLKPFDKLTARIAAINQAEVKESSALPYFNVFVAFGFENIGDIDNLVKECGEDAYHLATYEFAATDLDIMASTVSVQHLCEVYILKRGGGVYGLVQMLDMVYGKSAYNQDRAERVLEAAGNLPFMNKKQ